MKKLPSLKQLQHLIALFDHQHFGKAASACFISQSTLSASIIQLEETLGLPLLERDHKAFIFTSLAEGIVARSRALIENAQDLMDYVQHEGQLMHGTLGLGCIPTIAPFLMGTLMATCREMYPGLKLFIREDTTDNLVHSLKTGQMDIIILALPCSTANLYTEGLCQDPFHLVFPKSLAAKIKDKDLNAWPDECIFLLEKEHCLAQHTLQACALRNTKKINPFYASSLHTLVQMVSSGLGVTFLPQLAIQGGILASSGLMDLALPTTAHREIGIAWRASSHKQESYRLFADMLKTVLRQLISKV